MMSDYEMQRLKRRLAEAQVQGNPLAPDLDKAIREIEKLSTHHFISFNSTFFQDQT